MAGRHTVSRCGAKRARCHTEIGGVITQAARLLRGTGYEAVPGPGRGSAQSAVAAPYAHVTAPLRRLGDRFNNEIILAVHAGHEPPQWAVDALGSLPEELTAAGTKSGTIDTRSWTSSKRCCWNGRSDRPFRHGL